MKPFILTTCLSLLSLATYSQDYWDDWNSYSIDEVYAKQDLPYGSLDENGSSIDYVYIPSELKAGSYEVVLVDADGDLYEIKGSEIYLTFVGYLGYAGYSGKEGILEINMYGGGYFYERP